MNFQHEFLANLVIYHIIYTVTVYFIRIVLG